MGPSSKGIAGRHKKKLQELVENLKNLPSYSGRPIGWGKAENSGRSNKGVFSASKYKTEVSANSV